MPWCPQCKYEYKPGKKNCPDCGSTLVDKPPETKLRDIKLVRAYQASNELEAITIKSFLEKEKIPATIRSLQIPWFDNIVSAGCGVWGEILVSSSDLNRSKEIISDYLRGKEVNGNT